MATEAQIKINLDANKATKQLKDLNAEGKKTNATFQAVDKTFEEVYGDLKPLTTRMGEAEDRLYELSLAGKQATAEYKALLKTVGDYRRVQIQTDMAVDAAALTITQKLTTGLGAAAGGFAVVEGAMAAAGATSEEFEAVMQKLAGVMAVLQGLNELRESAPLLKQLLGGFGGAAQGAEELGKAVAAATSHTSDYVAAGADVVASGADIVNSSRSAAAATQATSAANEILAATQRQVNVAQKESIVDWAAKRQALLQEEAALDNLLIGKEQVILAGAESTASYDAEIAAIEAKIVALKAELATQNQSTASTTANTVATGANTIATEVNVTAQEALAIAQKEAALAAKSSALAFAGILGVIALVGFAVVELIKHNKKLNEEEKLAQKQRAEAKKEWEARKQAMQEERDAVRGTASEYAGLIIQLKNTTAGSKERAAQIKAINDQYGTTLQNLKDETAFTEQLNKSIRDYITLQVVKIRVDKNAEKLVDAIDAEEKAQAKLDEARRKGAATAKLFNITLEQLAKGNYTEADAIREAQAELVRKQLAIGDLYTSSAELTNQMLELQKGFKSVGTGGDGATVKLSAAEQAAKDFADRLATLGNAFQMSDLDPTNAFPVDRFITEILQAETEINRKRLDLTGTFGAERLALEEQLRAAELALLDLQLQKELDAAGNNADLKLKIESEYALKRYDILSKSSLQVQDLAADEAEATKKWAEMSLEERVTLVQSYMDKIAELEAQATETIAMFQQNRQDEAQAALDSRYEQEQLALEGHLANQKISQEQYDSDMRELEQTRREEQKRLDREAFDRNKKIQISNATMQTAQAVLAAFSSGVATPLIGPATGAVYAAIAAAFGAAQIAAISKAPFTAARGGIVPGAGSGRVDTVDAKLAPGEAVINSASTSTFLPVLNAINQLGGGKPLVPTQNSALSTPAGYAQPQVVKAYVVEREMTEMQASANRLKRNSRLFR